ncbi:MAG: SMC-Scp complex subunit ScpB [Ruminococcus sp.]|nr:SMC-Scp complex subunit ScpB [Candidatus Copronaster equi]
MKMTKIQAAVEAILFAAGEPLESERIAQAMEIEINEVEFALDGIKKVLDESESGICLVKMENKYQLCTRQDFAAEVRAALEIKKNTPLSNAAFEVLAVIAYNQPVTKSFVEQVRGVDCSGVIQTLIAKGLVEERGRLELPGRPLVYGTTSEFLKCFCVSSLDELPDLPEHEDMPKNEELADQLEINLENGDVVGNKMFDPEQNVVIKAQE